MEKMELSEALKANASVLEGLLPIVSAENNGLMSKNGFITRELINDTSQYKSFNDITMNGIYFIGGSYDGTDGPVSDVISSGFITVYNHNNTVIEQVFYIRSSSDIYKRTYDSGRWRSWEKA